MTMAHPESLHISLLRPCVLYILRAAGYHSAKTSVIDSLTDLMARYFSLLADTAASNALVHHTDPELSLELSIQDVRIAFQECGVFPPENEDSKGGTYNAAGTSGVDDFIAWATGPVNKEIRRITMDSSEIVRDDYLTVLKKKHATTGDEESRYVGTLVGMPNEHKTVKVEGSEFSSLKEWEEKLRDPVTTATLTFSRRQSSALSSLGDATIESMEF